MTMEQRKLNFGSPLGANKDLKSGYMGQPASSAYRGNPYLQPKQRVANHGEQLDSSFNYPNQPGKAEDYQKTMLKVMDPNVHQMSSALQSKEGFDQYSDDDLNESFVINSSKRGMVQSEQDRVQSTTGGHSGREGPADTPGKAKAAKVDKINTLNALNNRISIAQTGLPLKVQEDQLTQFFKDNEQNAPEEEMEDFWKEKEENFYAVSKPAQRSMSPYNNYGRAENSYPAQPEPSIPQQKQQLLSGRSNSIQAMTSDHKRPVRLGDYSLKDNNSVPNLDIAGVVDIKQLGTTGKKDKRHRPNANSQAIRASGKNIVFKNSQAPSPPDYLGQNQYGLHSSIDSGMQATGSRKIGLPRVKSMNQTPHAKQQAIRESKQQSQLSNYEVQSEQYNPHQGVVAIYNEEDDNSSLNPAERFHAIKMRKHIDVNRKPPTKSLNTEPLPNAEQRSVGRSVDQGVLHTFLDNNKVRDQLHNAPGGSPSKFNTKKRIARQLQTHSPPPVDEMKMALMVNKIHVPQRPDPQYRNKAAVKNRTRTRSLALIAPMKEQQSVSRSYLKYIDPQAVEQAERGLNRNNMAGRSSSDLLNRRLVPAPNQQHQKQNIYQTTNNSSVHHVQEVAQQLEESFRGERQYVKNAYPGSKESQIPTGVFPALNQNRNPAMNSIEVDGNSLGIYKKNRYQTNQYAQGLHMDITTQQQQYEVNNRIPQKKQAPEVPSKGWRGGTKEPNLLGDKRGGISLI